MAATDNKKISQTPQATSLTGTEAVPALQGGNNVFMMMNQVVSYLSSLFSGLAAANAFTKGQTVTTVALTDGATIATDASLGNHFKVTLGGNRALANPTNLQDGQIINWRVTQDVTGTRTLTFGSMFKWSGGSAPALTSAANSVDYITAQYFADTGVLIASSLGDIR